MTRVIGIVILKRKIHKIQRTIFQEKKLKRILENNNEAIQIFSKPNLSAKNQPKAFQKITQKVKIKGKINPVFQGKGTINPIIERIQIANKIKIQTHKSKFKLSGFSIFSYFIFGIFTKSNKEIVIIAKVTK